MNGPYVGRAYRNGLRIGGVKLTLGASPQGRTAWLSQPYLKPPEGGAPIIASSRSWRSRP